MGGGLFPLPPPSMKKMAMNERVIVASVFSAVGRVSTREIIVSDNFLMKLHG